MREKIGMVSLGCAKNQVNAEQMLYLLKEAGFEISGDPAGCDLAIVNTCGFIESAKAEAIDHILALGQLKAAGQLGKILVTGCLSQRYQDEILTEMPEVDGVLGTGSYGEIVSAVVLRRRLQQELDDGRRSGIENAHGDEQRRHDAHQAHTEFAQMVEQRHTCRTDRH